MRAVIVAAGQGSRLREVASPKPLVQVRGRPLIAHVIDDALAAGVSDFVVVTGYEAAKLECFLAEIAGARGVKLRCVHNPAFLSPNGLSVVAAAPFVEERFLLLMADHLFDPSIIQDLILGAPRDAELVLAIDRRLDNPLVDLDDVTRVDVAEDGRIRRIGKALTQYNAFDTGIFLASPGLIRAVREDVAQGGGGSISAGVLRLAARGLAATFDIGDRFWIDIDDAAALNRAENSPVCT